MEDYGMWEGAAEEQEDYGWEAVAEAQEGDGMWEAAAEAQEAPPTPTYDDSDVNFEIKEAEIQGCEYNYHGGDTWSGAADDYSSYYRDYLTETDKGNFLKVPVRYLESFCTRNHAPWLREMLTDAALFYKLHKTWEVYICPSPDCLCWFSDDDSLVLHLMREHCNVWPILRHNLNEEQWSAKVLHNTVWKPIDVKAAVNRLNTILLDGKAADSRLDARHLGSMEWPLSEDSRRSELLAALQRGFEVLLDSQEVDSFIVRSNGCLRALIAVASEEILRRIDPTDTLPLQFRVLLFSSSLSFRFMEEDPLRRFVQLVEGLCNLAKNQATQIKGSESSEFSDVNWSKGEYLDAIFFSTGRDYFALDSTKLNLCGVDEKDVGSWLFKAPMFPLINKVPDKAIDILLSVKSKAASLSGSFATVFTEHNFKLAGLASYLQLWNMGHWPKSLLDMPSPEFASNSACNPANVYDMPFPPCNSASEPTKQQKIEFGSQQYLELIKLTCELQFYELQFRQLCAVDLRMFILPLLRSCLRMKLYMFIRIGYSGTGDVQEEDADRTSNVEEEDADRTANVEEEDADGVLDVEKEDPDGSRIMEGAPEEHPEEQVHNNVEGEPTGAEDGNDVMIPAELSPASPELEISGSSATGVSDIDSMIIDGGQAGANAGGIDNIASHVGTEDPALSRCITDLATVIAESEDKPEAIPESNDEPESKAEPISQQPQIARRPLYSEFDGYFDSDIPLRSEQEIEDDRDWELENPNSSDVVWYLRGKRAWETKDKGLFVRMMFTDVMKHCLENISLHAALYVWRWKTNRTWEYWCCFACDKRFPDQNSHMFHMESEHHLGLSWDQDCLVPSQVWKEYQSRVNEGIKKRTHCLDDSIKVDSIYRTFLVEMDKFGSSFQNEEKGEVQSGDLFEDIVRSIQEQLSCFVNMFDTKGKLYCSSNNGELDSEIEENFARLKMLKHKLSNLCVSDYKNEVLPSISSFLRKLNLMDSGLRSWALQRLNDLLGSIRSPWHPDSFSLQLESPGKVVINIEENNAGIIFAYVGICWKFSGDLSFKGSRNIKGLFVFSGVSHPGGGGMQYDPEVILDEKNKRTMKICSFIQKVRWSLSSDVLDKLKQFEAEFRGRIQC